MVVSPFRTGTLAALLTSRETWVSEFTADLYGAQVLDGETRVETRYRGADIAFLSAFPAEEEYLFPPLTYLEPTPGGVQTLRVDEANLHRH